MQVLANASATLHINIFDVYHASLTYNLNIFELTPLKATLKLYRIDRSIIKSMDGTSGLTFTTHLDASYEISAFKYSVTVSETAKTSYLTLLDKFGEPTQFINPNFWAIEYADLAFSPNYISTYEVPFSHTTNILDLTTFDLTNVWWYGKHSYISMNLID